MFNAKKPPEHLKSFFPKIFTHVCLRATESKTLQKISGMNFRNWRWVKKDPPVLKGIMASNNVCQYLACAIASVTYYLSRKVLLTYVPIVDRINILY